MSSSLPKLDFFSPNFENDGVISPRFAFCQPEVGGVAKTKEGGNVSPELRWALPPELAPSLIRSFALLVVDPDVPSRFEEANQEGKVISASLARRDFYHWALSDLPPETRFLPEGIGKKVGPSSLGVSGVNDYARFFTNRPRTDFLGYDGPCPPWNDERLHHYVFRLYALSCSTLGLPEGFDPRDMLPLLPEHTVAEGVLVGTYTTFQGVVQK